MREQPDGAALLQAAEQLLRKEILPALPPGQRQAALMIASAMAIAQRQFEGGDGGLQAESAALAELLDAPAGHALDELNVMLAQRIRRGDADPGSPTHDAALRQLRRATRLRVQESCPKVLLGS